MEKMCNIDIVKENEEIYKTRRKEICDRKARERKFEIGDLVLVRNPDNKIHGFSQVLSGLYVVTAVIHTKYTCLTDQINATNST